MKQIDLTSFSPITLAEMDEVKLMKRVDTKFIVHVEELPDILNQLTNDYRVLEIDNNRLMTYDSLYYDTENLDFYFDHHNSIAHRIKIRKRNYVESALTFLEIKQKDNKGVTRKTRRIIPTHEEGLTKDHINFIEQTTDLNLPIQHTISNRFNRFTLVGNQKNERVTVDTNLAYDGEIFNEKLAIIELKQARLDRSSSLFQALREKGIHPYSISKYCIGMAVTNPTLKQNHFKPKILRINKKIA